MHHRPASERRRLGFVPAPHRWLTALCASLERGRIAVGEAVLADGALRVTLSPRTAHELAVMVRPRNGKTRGVAATQHFSVGYEGERDLLPRQRAMLSRMVELLGRLEHEIPPGLAGHAAIVQRTRTPERDLQRLFPFVDVERSRGSADTHTEVLVRATQACNQACPFCSAPRHDEPSEEALRTCFKAVSKLLPGAHLVITGGEPGLRPRLLDEVAFALALPGIGSLQVQTNAVPFAKKHDPSRLAPEARASFFVSLHAVEPALYDACTASRGQLATALQGIGRLLGAGHGVTLNTVVSRLNLDHMTQLAERVAELFGGPNRPRLHISALMCPERSPAAAQLLVPYSELVPVVERAVEVAKRGGLEVESLLASTHASLPACVVPRALRRDRQRPELALGETGGESDATPWVKAERCAVCVEHSTCLGVPRAYAERFGMDDFEPLVR